MSRKTTEKIADLERSLAHARQGQKDEHNTVRKLTAFLKNLLEIEPSLGKYCEPEDNDWGYREWDYEGVAQAVEFRRQEAVADEYAPKKASA